jgi:hypothetical protein
MITIFRLSFEQSKTISFNSLFEDKLKFKTGISFNHISKAVCSKINDEIE